MQLTPVSPQAGLSKPCTWILNPYDSALHGSKHVAMLGSHVQTRGCIPSRAANHAVACTKGALPAPYKPAFRQNILQSDDTRPCLRRPQRQVAARSSSKDTKELLKMMRAQAERGPVDMQGSEIDMQQLAQQLAQIQDEEGNADEDEGEEEEGYEYTISDEDTDFDNLEVDDKFLFEELGLTPDEVEQQRDMSRAGFTDPEGIEFDHDEVSGAEHELPQELKLALLDKNVYGPEAVVLAGFPPEELGMVRAVLDTSGGAIIKALPVTNSEQLHCSVDEMIWSEEQDWSQPRVQNVESEGSLLAGWGNKRTILFSGLSVKAQATILEVLDSCGLQGVIGCMALEQDGPRRLGDVLAAAVQDERNQLKHHRQQRLQKLQEQQQQQRQQQKKQQQQKVFQDSPFSSEAVRSGSLPLPEGWSGRVVEDLDDLGSLEDLIGKQARERMMQELSHASPQKQAASSSNGSSPSPGTDSDFAEDIPDPDDARTRIIDAVIGPALGRGNSIGSSTGGKGSAAEVGRRLRQQEEQLLRRQREQEAREQELVQRMKEQEADLVKRLEEEQQQLKKKHEALMQQMGPVEQQQSMEQQQQTEDASDSEADSNVLFEGLPDFENPLDDLFQQDDPQRKAPAAQQQQQQQQDDQEASLSLPISDDKTNLFGGLPEFENPLDDLLSEAKPHSGRSAAAGQDQQGYQQLLQQQEQKLRQEKQEVQLSEQGLSILELIQRGLQQNAPTDELKQLVDAACAVEKQQQQAQASTSPSSSTPQPSLQEQAQSTSSPPTSSPHQPSADRQQAQPQPQSPPPPPQRTSHQQQHSLPPREAQPGVASTPLNALTDAPPSTSTTASAFTDPPPSTSSGDTGPSRMGRTDRGSIFNRGPKTGSGASASLINASSSKSVQDASVSARPSPSPSSLSSTMGNFSGSSSSSSGPNSSSSPGSNNTSGYRTEDHNSTTGASSAAAAAAGPHRSRLARSWNKAKPAGVPYGPEPPPPPSSPEQQGLHSLRPEALRKLEGKNVQFVDLSKLPTKYRRQMAERMKEQKEQQLLRQLRLQQAQQAQAEADELEIPYAGRFSSEGGGRAGGERDGEDEEEDGDELEGVIGGGSEMGSIVGSVSGTRRGRLAGMLQRSLKRKVKVIRTQEGEGEGGEGLGSEEWQQQQQQQIEQEKQREESERGIKREGKGREASSSRQRALSGAEVVELVGAAKQQGLDPFRMLAEAIAMGVLITPGAAAAAGMRLPGQRLVAVAKRELANQGEAGTGDHKEGMSDDADENVSDDEEPDDGVDEGGDRGSFTAPRSASRAVRAERQRWLKQEQRAVWQQRTRAWQGLDEEEGEVEEEDEEDDEEGVVDVQAEEVQTRTAGKEPEATGHEQQQATG